MKKESAKKIIALIMSFALLVSSVGVTATLLGEGAEVSINVESAETSKYTWATVDKLSEGIKSAISETAEVLDNASKNLRQEVSEKTDIEVTESAVISGKEYDLTSIKGIVKALVNARSLLELKYIGLALLENIFDGILSGISNALPTPPTISDIGDFVSKDFYEGTESFKTEAEDDAVWSLGYAQQSLVPNDVLTKDYYLGGYLLQQLGGNKVEEVIDDMKVRVIAMNDGSSGTVIFATMDSIGISNKDIRVIREALSEYASKNNIISINVCATHCHSCIDTQGLWNPLLPTIVNNTYVNLTGKGELVTGTDEHYMEFLTQKTVKAIKDACEDMEEGKLYFSEYDASAYYSDDRASADGVDSVVDTLGRFTFYPTSGSTPTIIVNGGAHPSITGLKTSESTGRELSSDYVATMEEVINEAGFDFMFFNGAISGVYPDRGLSGDGVETTHRYEIAQRYGYELGLHVIYMTNSEAEIAKDKFAKEALNKYLPADYSESGKGTLWYKGKVACEEIEVEPMLNIRNTEVLCKVTSPIILAVGKLGFTNTNIVKDDDGNKYYITEIGYVEIGQKKIIMLPGEISPDLFTGLGSYTAEGSATQTEYAYPTFPEIAGDEDLLVIGLANDAIGYVVPDNDFCNCIVDGKGHYQETISLGRETASTLSKAFMELIDSIK